MTKEEFIAEIELQKERGRKLLQQVQQMHVKRNYIGDGMAVFGRSRLYYTPEEELGPVKAEYASWKLYVHDFLLSVLDKDDGFISEWDKCLQTPHRHDISDRDWYSKEIGEALSKLDSFTQRIGFRFIKTAKKEETIQQVKNKNNKHPLVFISHSSGDKALIQSFVENVLILGLGLDKEDIAFTSHEVYGVEPGDRINRYIKDNIEEADIILLMISQNYKKSEVCLNEMGAAWALDKFFVSVLLPNAGFDKLGWLTNFEKAVKVDNKDQVVSLSETIVNALSIDISKRLKALFSYIDKFLVGLGVAKEESKPTEVTLLKVGNIDAEIKKAINQLGEFTIKELQKETGIKDYHFLSNKILAMVKDGTLEAVGSSTHRKYKVKHISNPLF